MTEVWRAQPAFGANTDGFRAGNRLGQANQAECVRYGGLHYGTTRRVWWLGVLWKTLRSSGYEDSAQHNPFD